MAKRAGRPIDLFKLVESSIVHSANEDLAQEIANGEVATEFMNAAISRGTIPFVRGVSGYACFDRSDVGHDAESCNRNLHTENPDPVKGFVLIQEIKIKPMVIDVPMASVDAELIARIIDETHDVLVETERISEVVDMVYAGRDSVPVKISARLELYVKDPEFMRIPMSMQGPYEEEGPIHPRRRQYYQEFPRGKGQKKSKKPFETIEEMEQRKQFDRESAVDAFQEETAGSEEMPVGHFVEPASAEALARYIHKPEMPEMTWSDIYDAVKCRGRFSILRAYGFPCDEGWTYDPYDPKAIKLAIEYLLSVGYKMPADMEIP